MLILKQKVQRRLQILSQRLSNIETAISEISNPDESLLATRDSIGSKMEKIQLTWGQRLNMAESGVKYEIIAREKLMREKQSLKQCLKMESAPAEEIAPPGQKFLVDWGRGNDEPS